MEKRIMLFMTSFYGYYKSLIEEFMRRDYYVKWYDDCIHLNLCERVISKFFPIYKKKKFDKYFFKSIQNENSEFDKIIIVFAANYFEKKHVECLRKRFPTSEIVYYAWDSVKNFPKIENLFKSCDRSYSFDDEDSKKYHVGFLPLFYNNHQDILFKKNNCSISTVMTIYPEKVPILCDLLDSLPSNIPKNIYLYIPDMISFLRIRLFYPKFYEKYKMFIHMNALSLEETNKRFAEANIIIDCPLPHQNGLTMRTFETLSKGKKLYTSNLSIKKYDFYTTDMIRVYPIDKLDGFFEKQSYGNILDSKYDIKHFVEVLLFEKDTSSYKHYFKIHE